MSNETVVIKDESFDIRKGVRSYWKCPACLSRNHERLAPRVLKHVTCQYCGQDFPVKHEPAPIDPEKLLIQVCDHLNQMGELADVERDSGVVGLSQWWEEHKPAPVDPILQERQRKIEGIAQIIFDKSPLALGLCREIAEKSLDFLEE